MVSRRDVYYNASRSVVSEDRTMNKKNCYNPYLPCWEYIPDGEPHIVGDRVYVYGSHDLFDGISFCLGDYVCWSAPVEDLSDWKYEGVIYRRDQDPNAKKPEFLLGLAAPDMVQGPDGRFYLYYFMGGTKKISVAVCDTPAGKYEYYGDVRYPDGVAVGFMKEPFMFDPGMLMDDDGKLYMYVGFALENNPLLLMGNRPTRKGPMCFELDTSDMLTVKKGPIYIGVGALEDGNEKGYKGHLFLEASSMRKFDGRYYFIYSSLNSHELCYAVSDIPTGDFTYGGTLVSNGDIGLSGISDVKHARNNTGNTHGSLIKLGDRYYVFYHRQTNRMQSSRQACAEEIRFENGKFYQAEMTSQSFNKGPLSGKGLFPSYIACNLYGRDGTRFLSMIKHRKGNTPYLTQDGKDYVPNEPGETSVIAHQNSESCAKVPVQYIANFCNGAVAGFKYFDLSETTGITVNLSGRGYGFITIRTSEDGKTLLRIPVHATQGKKTKAYSGVFPKKLTEKEAIYIGFKGKGRFKLLSFELQGRG